MITPSKELSIPLGWVLRCKVLEESSQKSVTAPIGLHRKGWRPGGVSQYFSVGTQYAQSFVSCPESDMASRREEIRIFLTVPLITQLPMGKGRPEEVMRVLSSVYHGGADRNDRCAC